MISKRLAAGIALLFLAVLVGLNLTGRGVRPISNAAPLEVTGPFLAGHEPLATRGNSDVRTWKLPASAAKGSGTIKLGPFTAPAHLSLLVAGNWDQAGNTVSLEMVGLGLLLPLDVKTVTGTSQLEEFEIPFGWRGRPVILVAVASAQTRAGPITISEPLRGGSTEVFSFGLSSEIGAFVIVGFFLMATFWAAALWLTELNFPSHWVALGAGAVVSVFGYGAYWAYFAGPVVGKFYSGVFLAASLVAWIKAPSPSVGKKSEWPAVIAITFAIGIFYIAIVYFFGIDRDLYDLAGIRFIRGLPGDNRLPHDIGMLLYHGLSPKHPGGDWLSSDRPPLQCGLQLLTWPLTQKLGFEETIGSSACGIWLQLLWVAAVDGLLRTLGMKRRRSRAWLAVIALNGICFSNTVYTWPKLGAGAFACGAVCLWFASDHRKTKLDFAMGGAMVALALLAHGGVVFSLLALAPFVLWSFFQGNRINWSVAAVVAASLFIPWLCYQKFYEPPGNRLIKWHIGGQIPVDERGTWQTIRESYGRLSSTEIRERKIKSFKALFEGDWATLLSTNAQSAESRRNDEFNHVARAFGLWLIVGTLASAIALMSRSRRAQFLAANRGQLFFVLWTGLTLVIWCLLLFEPAAIIFLGSYSVMLTGLCLFSVWIENSGRYWLPIFAPLQLFQFSVTWMPASGGVSANLFVPAAIVAVGAMAVISYLFLTSLSDRPEAPELSSG